MLSLATRTSPTLSLSLTRLLSTSSHFTNVLGVSHHDSLATIKSTFRALAKKYHPDLGHPDASEAKIAEILSAYQDACDEWASVC
jgi:DnaJ-class molecular chaperone